MPGEHTMAIDAGTGSCRAVIFAADGRQVAVAQTEWSHRPVAGVPGSQDFAVRENWAAICGCVRRASAQAGLPDGAIAAVSATSMREGMVLYDAGGTELWACPNVDSRARVEAEELVASGAAEAIYAQAGDWVAITSPARFRWLARHVPEVLEATAHMGMLSDWIVTRLSGRFVTEPSAGSSSGLFDLASRAWSPELLELCGIDAAIVPEVVETGAVVGAVTSLAAEETGLPAGTPVVAGGADTQLALLGLGVTEPGRSTVIGGSFWQHTAIAETALIDPRRRLRTLCHAMPGRWMIEGIGFYSGLTMRWFRDAFCAPEAEAARRAGEDPYAAMEAMATGVPPGSDGVVGLFSNLMEARRWVHAAPTFAGFDIADPGRSGKKECIRAIEEAAAYVVRGHAGIVEELTGDGLDRVVFTGGGAQGQLWPQVLADVLGVPVWVPEGKESTAFGAALLAGAAVGLHEDAATAARRVVRYEAPREPDPDAHGAYDELYATWRAAYAGALELSEAGLMRPLWRAAGT